MKIEFTKDEMGMLTAMVLAMSEDVEKGMFDQADGEMANFKLMASELEGVMDAEILDEEE